MKASVSTDELSSWGQHPVMGMELKASDYVRAKLRQAFCLYEGTMDPVRALMASSWVLSWCVGSWCGEWPRAHGARTSLQGSPTLDG